MTKPIKATPPTTLEIDERQFQARCLAGQETFDSIDARYTAMTIEIGKYSMETIKEVSRSIFFTNLSRPKLVCWLWKRATGELGAFNRIQF